MPFHRCCQPANGTHACSNYETLLAGEVNKKNGWDIRIHVDGASGAMVAPFIFPGVLLGFFRPAMYIFMLWTTPFAGLWHLSQWRGVWLSCPAQPLALQ